MVQPKTGGVLGESDLLNQHKIADLCIIERKFLFPKQESEKGGHLISQSSGLKIILDV